MDTKSLIVSNNNLSTQSTILHKTDVTQKMFLDNYMLFMKPYIAKGLPSENTIKDYTKAIESFLLWCKENNSNPLDFEEFEIRQYVSYLRDQFLNEHTIAQKLAALRGFYKAAIKTYVKVGENPVLDISTRINIQNDIDYISFTIKELGEIENALIKISGKNLFIQTRNLLIFYLMCVEGLRNIELHRANIEDINWNKHILLIHGKGSIGRKDYIYPCEKTFHLLQEYMAMLNIYNVNKEKGSPLIISVSNQSFGKRISQNGLRDIMNRALKESGYKESGISCHVFRHSCGTNLYEQTKDIRIVQETLRHRDPRIASRYAHLRDRLTNRQTKNILPQV